MAMSSFTVFFFTVVLKLFFFLKKKFKCENKDTRTARRTSKRKSHEKILKHIKKPLWGIPWWQKWIRIHLPKQRI